MRGGGVRKRGKEWPQETAKGKRRMEKRREKKFLEQNKESIHEFNFRSTLY